MKPYNAIKILAVFGSLIFSYDALALFETIDSTAPVVQLRTSCVENSVTLRNCFTAATPSPTNRNALTSWMATVRKPNSASPLQVNIGPGTFGTLSLTCDAAGGYTGFTSFKGAGRSVSIFAGVNAVIGVNDCDKLDFNDLGVRGTTYSYIGWSGGGHSTWQNVNVDNDAYGWLENYCGATPGQHYWFGSKINANSAATTAKGYATKCDESWFFGSDIGVTLNESSGNASVAFDVTENATVHVYGSVIRANAGSAGSSSANPGLIAARVSSPTASMHIHGTGIDVISVNPIAIAALSASNGGMIHANEAAYNLQTGTGATTTRVINSGGHIHAPYEWAAHPTPPAITSVTGFDSMVETDCASTGCQNTGTETHLLIYNSSCATAGPWFDIVTGRCRGL